MLPQFLCNLYFLYFYFFAHLLKNFLCTVVNNGSTEFLYTMLERFFGRFLFLDKLLKKKKSLVWSHFLETLPSNKRVDSIL